ncbi:MAG: amidophosphoribosyltransferase [bacterium]|nr:amidophosphoribosyltransferase [bacterium]
MCGIFGGITKEFHPDFVVDVIDGLSRLQPRGEEGAGILYSDGNQVWSHKKYGLVSQVFTPDKVKEIIERRPNMIIGQTHYSTSGNKTERNIPPPWIEPPRGRMGLVHNGNIPNLEIRKKDLESESREDIRFDRDPFEKMNDSEFMLKKIYWLMSQNRWDIVKALSIFIETVPGSYSAAFLSRDGVLVFRDTYSNRPLFKLINDKVVYFGSETCAFPDLKAGHIRSFEAGEILRISPKGEVRSNIFVTAKNRNRAHCVFENIYFARPDSLTFTDRTESHFRRLLGKYLAMEDPVPDADFVVCVPESGRPFSEGFANEISKPALTYIIRDNYIGRTFIHPNQKERKILAKKKYSLVNEPSVFKNKVVVLCDDSIVRLTTMRRLVPMILEAGAKEVHVRISAPPTISPCYYGIDMPDKKELVAANLSLEQIRRKIKAKTLAYNSLETVEKVIRECGRDPVNFCKACFTGEYPIPLT